jgi:predicted metal-dependent peptidase
MSEHADDTLIRAALLRLRMRSPYFATLALFATVTPSTVVERAATDGRTVFVNPRYLATLPTAEQDTLVLHQVLHAALLHVGRRGARDPRLWNIACDLVVNGLTAQINGLRLPDGALRDSELEQLSVEEAYELLQRDPSRVPDHADDDLLLADPSGPRSASGGTEEETRGSGRNAILEAHWRNARDQAQLLSLMVAQGSMPTGLQRELGMLNPAALDWRAYLWRYLVQTPSDFVGFDRRFISRGLYLDALAGESAQVYVAVDTSGSIDERQIGALASEVQAILGAYPHLECTLYYADAAVYGPYALTASSPLPPPTGGGGSDFRPFFAAVAEQHRPHLSGVCIYLTDGYGQFPAAPPPLPVLWVVTPGGLGLEGFPFGEAVRLLAEA